jgi:hypothetical protein
VKLGYRISVDVALKAIQDRRYMRVKDDSRK